MDWFSWRRVAWWCQSHQSSSDKQGWLYFIEAGAALLCLVAIFGLLAMAACFEFQVAGRGKEKRRIFRTRRGENYHAKGFWKYDELHLVSLPSLSAAPIVPTPVSKAPMITSSLPSAERSLMFKKYHGSWAIANASCRTPISSELSNSSTVTGKSRTILKQPIAAVTLTHIEKLMLMDERSIRRDPFASYRRSACWGHYFHQHWVFPLSSLALY